MTVRFGFAETDITPGNPVLLGGYAARSGRSTGVHDALRAQVLSFLQTLAGQEVRRVVLVVLDLLGLSGDSMGRLSRELEALTGVPSASFCISCSHTHSGPDTLSLFSAEDQREKRYLRALPERLSPAVDRALRAESPLRMSHISGYVDGVGASRWSRTTSRRDRQGVKVDVTRMNQTSLVTFGCHPTVLGAQNTMLSADLFGAARRVIEDDTGHPAVLLQGACADVSTRYVRDAQDSRETRRLGARLARRVRELLDARPPAREVESLSSTGGRVTPPLREPPDLEEAEARLREHESRAALSTALSASDSPAEPLPNGAHRELTATAEGMRIELARARAREENGASRPGSSGEDDGVNVVAFRLGELAFLGVGGELSSSLGREISGRSPYRQTLVLGCTGGYAGYILSGREFSGGGYESRASSYAPGVGEAVVEHSVRLLQSLCGHGNPEDRSPRRGEGVEDSGREKHER